MSPELKILFCCHHRERHDKRCLAAAALSGRLKLVAVGERVDGSNNDELCGARRLTYAHVYPETYVGERVPAEYSAFLFERYQG